MNILIGPFHKYLFNTYYVIGSGTIKLNEKTSLGYIESSFWEESINLLVVTIKHGRNYDRNMDIEEGQLNQACGSRSVSLMTGLLD